MTPPIPADTEPAPSRPVAGARDVVAVAFQRAMSNGPLSRRLGWIALVLLPLTIPVQLPAVLVGGDQVLCSRGASLMRGRDPQLRPGAVLAALLGPFLIVVVLLIIDLGTGLPVGWSVVGALAFIVIESAGSLPARWLRQVWRAARHQPLPVPEATIDTRGLGPAVTVAFVVAFPRGGERGSSLMSGLEVLLDAAAQPAVLSARTAGLVGFYAQFGFCSLGGDPRQMLRLPTAT